MPTFPSLISLSFSEMLLKIPRRAVVYVACLSRPALKPLYKDPKPSCLMMSPATLNCKHISVVSCLCNVLLSPSAMPGSYEPFCVWSSLRDFVGTSPKVDLFLTMSRGYA